MEHDHLKVVFICSSMEPGHDGVGDYTRRLASALLKAGHTCAVLSLNDKYVTAPLEESQQSDDINVPVLRLSAAIEIKQRFKLARAWVTAFDPQWISLQFVPFGYHSKGLKVGLGTLLMSLSKKANWHIMFHELWVGIAEEESAKLKIWGSGQRILIRALIKKIKPKMIHTQTQLYQMLLAKIGVHAFQLKLFGNIPVVIQPGKNDSKRRISFVVFGSIHNKAPIVDFAFEAAAYSLKNDIGISLTVLGRGDVEQRRWANAFESQGLEVEILGEQPAELVSEMFTNATFGLSATALAVIEKSGSYAAMREHGLPVISVAKHWTPRGGDKPAIPLGVIVYQPGNFEFCIANSNRINYPNNVFEVSDKFVQSLLRVNIVR